MPTTPWIRKAITIAASTGASIPPKARMTLKPSTSMIASTTASSSEK